jgi:hypothetical protein
LRRILDTTSLTRLDAAVVLVCGILPVAIVELYKRAIRPAVPAASDAKG